MRFAKVAFTPGGTTALDKIIHVRFELRGCWAVTSADRVQEACDAGDSTSFQILFNNVNVLCPLEVPTLERIKDLKQFSNEWFQEQIDCVEQGHERIEALRDALSLASRWMYRGVGIRKIVIITNTDMCEPVICLDEKFVKQLLIFWW